jgi:hypothetical protein
MRGATCVQQALAIQGFLQVPFDVLQVRTLIGSFVFCFLFRKTPRFDQGKVFACYLDAAGGKITARRVVVCINSIARVLPYFDLVVMDNVNFTLTNIASTVMKDKKRVFMALERIVASAKAAFLCNAHLNCPRVVEWIQILRHTSRFYTIRNVGVWPSTRKAFIMPIPGPLVGKRQPERTYSLIVEKFLDLVAFGKSVMVSIFTGTASFDLTN